MLTIIKLYLICDRQISRFQYDVKSACAAIRDSRHLDMESKRTSVCFWVTFSTCSMYVRSQGVKSGCWKTMTNKLPTNHIPHNVR